MLRDIVPTPQIVASQGPLEATYERIQRKSKDDDKTNPESSADEETSLALAFIAKGIPLGTDALELLFDNKIDPELPPRFDYVDLTDELAPDPNDVTGITSLYPAKKRLLAKFIPKYKKKLTDFIRTHQEMYSKIYTGGLTENKLVSSYPSANQSTWIWMGALGKLYKNKKDPMFLHFKETIKSAPTKPFLIIQGHGGQNESGEFSIGDSSGELSTDLTTVMERMGVSSDKYSAVILVSCNEAALTPPRINGVPIFYIEGEAKLATNKRTAKVVE